MDGISTKSKLHKRTSQFVAWIAPEPETREEIRKQLEEVQERIGSKAKEDGLTITATPQAGSFAKKTGLRRHMRGKSEEEGQDIDVPFVVKPAEENKYELAPLINKFLKYANDSYPDTEKEPTKSSVKLKFSNALSYDIVPLFATKDRERQILVRTTGEEVETSVQKHTEFVRRRTSKSEEQKGVVLFNECVRLMKWWRDVRCASGSYLEDVPSIIVDLLCAKAFDRLSVQATYPQTLAEWFAYLAHVVTKKEAVFFTDYVKPVQPSSSSDWSVLDPVNSSNNLAARWQSYEIAELAGWFQDARDTLNRTIAADITGDDNGSLEHMVQLLGSAFKNHCEGEQQ